VKKKLSFLAIIMVVVLLFSGCSAITKMVTGKIMVDYLEDTEDANAPKQVIDSAINDVLSQYLIDSNKQIKTTSISDYSWSISESSIKAIVDNPPGDTSGIVQAEGIELIYSYTITGEPVNSELEEINKNGALKFNISSMRYNADSDKLVSMTTAYANPDNDSPIISNLTKSPYISADIANITNKNPRAVVFINYSYLADINNGKLLLEKDFNLSSNDIAAIIAINRAVLGNPDVKHTGISSTLFSFPE